MRILVIAASGFLGERVFKELVRRGHTVSGPSLAGNTFGRFDITDRESCQMSLEGGHFDSVVNLAGSGVTAGSASEGEMRRVNYGGAIALGEAIAATKKPPWLVHASSGTEPREAHTPESAYSASKAEGTRALGALLESARIPFSVARIHNTYGPSQPSGRFVMRVIKSLLAGEEVHVKYPSRVRDFCYVEDVVCHLADMAEITYSSSSVSEIGTGKGTSLWNLVEIVRRRLGSSTNVMMTPITWASDLNEYQVGNSGDPGFLLCETSLEDGIDKVLRSLRCDG